MVGPSDRSEGGEPDERDGSSTAERVEDWLRGLRAQRAAGGDPGGKPSRGAGTAEDAGEAFIKAARRLAASPRAQQALARRLAAAQEGAGDPALRALAQALQSLGKDLSDVLSAMGSSGGAALLDRPEVVQEQERKLEDGGGGGGDDVYDDDEGGGGGGDDDEPWPTAFVGYRVGVVDSIDVGTCRDGCCTALFVDHPGLRAAVWFPTETAGEMAEKLAGLLKDRAGEAASLGVPPFGEGDPPARGLVQATIQFFTDDVHLDPAEARADVGQGGFVRFMAYDQGLGHGGPPLIDLLVSAEQSRALRRALRRAARNAPKEGS